MNVKTFISIILLSTRPKLAHAYKNERAWRRVLLAEPAALPSSQEMKVSMVNFSGRAPEDSPAPVEGVGTTGLVPLTGAEGADDAEGEATGVSTATGVAEASAMEDATGDATGTVEFAGVEGTVGVVLPEPSQLATGPPGAV